MDYGGDMGIKFSGRASGHTGCRRFGVRTRGWAVSGGGGRRLGGWGCARVAHESGAKETGGANFCMIWHVWGWAEPYRLYGFFRK